MRHVERVCELAGDTRHVALGSDFDGALIPRDVGDAAHLPALVQAMRDAGYGDDLVARICWGNWIDLLRRTWPS